MTDGVEETKVRGAAFGITVHNALEFAQIEIVNEKSSPEAECPNIWNYTLLALTYAENEHEKDGDDSTSSEFIERTRELDEKYGTEELHRMTKAERWDRLRAALKYFMKLGAHQLQDREEQWSDDELAKTEREIASVR